MYGLYQTLDKNIPRKDLTEKEKKHILKKIKGAAPDQLEAMFMLICEDARLHDDFEGELENYELPYRGKSQDEGVQFNLERFPRRLRWIIFRFCNVIK